MFPSLRFHKNLYSSLFLRFGILISLWVCISFQSVQALGTITTWWMVSSPTISTISAYSECKDVWAPSGTAIFVPTNTLWEWNAFKIYAPSIWASINACLVWKCGSADGKTYPSFASDYGSDNQCDVGISTNTAFPEPWSTAVWTCNASGGNATCSASRDSPIPAETVTGTMCDAGPCGDVNNVSITKNVTYYGWGRGIPTLVRVIIPTWLATDYMNRWQEIHYLFWTNFPLKFNKRYMLYNAWDNQFLITVNLTADNKVQIITEIYDGSPLGTGPWYPNYEVSFGTVTNPDRTHAALIPDEAGSKISYFSEKWCIDNGGNIVDMNPFDRSALCRLNNGSCTALPGNDVAWWKGYYNWTTTSSRTTVGRSTWKCSGYPDGPVCTTGSHPWGNISPDLLIPDGDACLSSAYYFVANWEPCEEGPKNIPSIVNQIGCY